MNKYDVYEDNAGGLVLIVKDDNNDVVYAHDYYEHKPGDLRRDVEKLSQGDDPSNWDGNDAALIDDVEDMQLIADQDGIYSDNMGVAALIEFV